MTPLCCFPSEQIVKLTQGRCRIRTGLEEKRWKMMSGASDEARSKSNEKMCRYETALKSAVLTEIETDARISISESSIQKSMHCCSLRALV